MRVIYFRTGKWHLISWRTENGKALGGCAATYRLYWICTGLRVPHQPSEENHFTRSPALEIRNLLLYFPPPWFISPLFYAESHRKFRVYLGGIVRDIRWGSSRVDYVSRERDSVTLNRRFPCILVTCFIGPIDSSPFFQPYSSSSSSSCNLNIS